MKFHHTGVITTDLETSVQFYRDLGYTESVVVDEEIQKLKLIFLQKPGSPLIELVFPYSSDSPAFSWIKRIQCGPYHTAYVVPSLGPAVELFDKHSASVVYGPVPAKFFNGNKILFLWGEHTGLIELIEDLNGDISF